MRCGDARYGTGQLDRVSGQVVQLESEMTDLVKRHSREADAWMATRRDMEQQHVEVTAQIRPVSRRVYCRMHTQ